MSVCWRWPSSGTPTLTSSPPASRTGPTQQSSASTTPTRTRTRTHECSLTLNARTEMPRFAPPTHARRAPHRCDTFAQCSTGIRRAPRCDCRTACTCGLGVQRIRPHASRRPGDGLAALGVAERAHAGSLVSIPCHVPYAAWPMPPAHATSPQARPGYAPHRDSLRARRVLSVPLPGRSPCTRPVLPSATVRPSTTVLQYGPALQYFPVVLSTTDLPSTAQYSPVLQYCTAVGPHGWSLCRM